MSSKQKKEDKETWWWDEEVQESIRKKRLARGGICRGMRVAKNKAYMTICTRLLDTKEGERILCRLARQRHQAGKVVQQVRMMKDKDGKVMTDEESVLRIWKGYHNGLMNAEHL